MKPLIQLITLWDKFEETHPEATIKDFCNYILIENDTIGNDNQVSSALDINVSMAKLISRLGAINSLYLKLALKDTGIDQEWFFVLNAVYQQKEAKKVDVINFLLKEQSTGIDLIKRIKKAGYLTERNDPQDKRARLVKLTPKGEKLLQSLWEPTYKTTLLLYNDMPDNEKQLVIKLLSDIEVKHQKIIAGQKNSTIDELIEQYVQNRKSDS